MIKLVVKNGPDLVFEGDFKNDEEADTKRMQLQKQYPNLPLNFRKKTQKIMKA